MKTTINSTVKALSHTPQYRMHKYFARRPYNVFSNLIEHYSDKGQIVLDIFCGGGVTVFEGVKLERNVIGVDLNPLATFITKMQMFNGDIKDLKKQIHKFISEKIDSLQELYNIHFFDDEGYCEWIEWAYDVLCPECGNSIILTEENKVKNGFYRCSNEKCSCQNGVARTKCKSNGAIPIRIKYISMNDKKVKVRILTKEEADIILKSEKNYYPKLKDLVYPSFEFPMNWDRQKEDKLYEKGILRYSDIYSNRNLYILSTIFKDIMQENESGNIFSDYLYFIFSSSLRYTNKMSRVTENWEGGNPTCMDKHAYYLPNSFIENNVINVFKERAKAIIKGCEFSKKELAKDSKESSYFAFNKDTCDYCIINGSSDSLPLPDESIDVIITDPPYGSNVQYAELSVVWNAWYQIYANKESFIYREKEAVSNRKRNYEGSKTEDDYEMLLYGIYKEAYRVLKNDSYMVFTFNNKNLNVWLAMLRAVAKSGFYLAENGVLFQDFISSYKNTSHLKYEGNVQGDFIYSFIKSKNIIVEDFSGKTIDDIIKDSLAHVINNFIIGDNPISSEILYKEVFTELASNLMKLIMYKQSIGKNIDDLTFEEKSIDNHLEKELVYTDSGWKKRDDNE